MGAWWGLGQWQAQAWGVHLPLAPTTAGPAWVHASNGQRAPTAMGSPHNAWLCKHPRPLVVGFGSGTGPRPVLGCVCGGPGLGNGPAATHNPCPGNSATKGGAPSTARQPGGPWVGQTWAPCCSHTLGNQGPCTCVGGGWLARGPPKGVRLGLHMATLWWVAGCPALPPGPAQVWANPGVGPGGSPHK